VVKNRSIFGVDFWWKMADFSPIFFWLCLHIYSFVPPLKSGGKFLLRKHEKPSSKNRGFSGSFSGKWPQNPMELDFKMNSFVATIFGQKYPQKWSILGRFWHPKKSSKSSYKTIGPKSGQKSTWLGIRTLFPKSPEKCDLALLDFLTFWGRSGPEMSLLGRFWGPRDPPGGSRGQLDDPDPEGVRIDDFMKFWSIYGRFWHPHGGSKHPHFGVHWRSKIGPIFDRIFPDFIVNPWFFEPPVFDDFWSIFDHFDRL